MKARDASSVANHAAAGRIAARSASIGHERDPGDVEQRADLGDQLLERVVQPALTSACRRALRWSRAILRADHNRAGGSPAPASPGEGVARRATVREPGCASSPRRAAEGVRRARDLSDHRDAVGVVGDAAGAAGVGMRRHRAEKLPTAAGARVRGVPRVLGCGQPPAGSLTSDARLARGKRGGRRSGGGGLREEEGVQLTTPSRRGRPRGGGSRGPLRRDGSDPSGGGSGYVTWC